MRRGSESIIETQQLVKINHRVVPAGTRQQPVGVATVPRTGQELVTDFNRRHRVVVFAGVDDDMVVHIIGDGVGAGPRQLYLR